MRIKAPETPAEFDRYYQLRWEVLRAPWQQPRGSEMAPDDVSATHALLLNDNSEAIGTCRMHLQTPQEAQIRFMAIHPDYQGKGLGQILLQYMEEKAREAGAIWVTLQAREKAVRFYEKNGYTVLEKSHLLFNSIQHFKMQKQLV